MIVCLKEKLERTYEKPEGDLFCLLYTSFIIVLSSSLDLLFSSEKKTKAKFGKLVSATGIQVSNFLYSSNYIDCNYYHCCLFF